MGTWNVASISGTEKDLADWFVQGLGIKGLSDNVAKLTVEGDNADLPPDVNIDSVAEQEASWRKKRSTAPRGDVPAVPGGTDIGLYVLGLQEIVDIASPTEALRPYVDPNPAKKWKQAIEAALPGYHMITENQLLGLYIMVYASPEVAPLISCVNATHVGTGVMGYLGNKGATCVRLVLGETTKLVFVNCHLAAGADKNALQRRIWDTQQILNRIRFDPVKDDDNDVAEEFVESIDDAEYAFWFGDLNYRLDDIPGDDVRRLLLLHTRNEYDVENKSRRKIDSELGYVAASEAASPSKSRSTSIYDDDLPLDPASDPASLHTTIKSLLSHDQLRNQQKQRQAFHEGWQEGEINFLPTYKYDVGSVGMFDSGEKKRSPSWCDRILYRSRRQKFAYEQTIKQEEKARQQNADLKERGLEDAASENDVLFAYDPDEDGLAYGDEYGNAEESHRKARSVQSSEEPEDGLSLDHYISHQRILSSDHKPLEAIFTLTYDAAVPELKAKIHQEAARELDKAENEGRPSVTVIIDSPPDSDNDDDADTSAEPIDVGSVDFGQVRYDIPKTRGLTVANTGRTMATFGFIDRPVAEMQKGGVSPTWLHISVDRHSKTANANENALKEYSLPPGETAHVSLNLHIDDFKTTHSLNSGILMLDDILVLRIVNGRDHFIPVHGVWMQSSLCRTLDDLVRIPEGGIRQLQKRQPQVLVNNESRSGESKGLPNDFPVQQSAPQELFALTESIQLLVERCVAEWEMANGNELPPWRNDDLHVLWPFDNQTWTFENSMERAHMMASVRERLDMGQSLRDMFSDDVKPWTLLEVFADALLTFLVSLQDGIISADLWARIEDDLNALDRAKAGSSSEQVQGMVLDIMSTSPVHNVSMTFIVFMLTKIISDFSTVQATMASPSPSRPNISTNGHGVEQNGDKTPTSQHARTPSSPQMPSPASKFSLPSLRRRRAATGSSTGTDSTIGATVSPPSVDKRQEILRAYATLFAGPLIRSTEDPHMKGKDKKVLEAKKVRVIEALLTSV